MVFDYADFDLTGLMETTKYQFTEPQVRAHGSWANPGMVAVVKDQKSCPWGVSAVHPPRRSSAF